MASPAKTGSECHEIVARYDQTCWKCRGKCLEGSRVRWDKRTSLVEHVTCPPVVEVAAEAYREPPVTPDLWKRYCASIVEMMADAEQMKKEKAVEKHKARCGTCGLEWTGYAKLAGTKHLAMVNRCGGTFEAV